MRHLFQIGEVTPIINNDGRIISIKVRIGDKKSGIKIIHFKDSYLLLPVALSNLCSTFNIIIGKSHFPFKLYDIFYNGVFPKFEYWTGIDLTQYGLLKTLFKGKNWSFKDEALKYCKLDCLVLHQILIKFNELIINNFKVNIHKVLTLPSLAMKIYRIHYMPKDSIYPFLGRPDWFIRESYTGGAVDVYIPHNRITGIISNLVTKFIKLFYYDVNSLYPFIMAKTPMPVGKPIPFQGDIRAIEPEAFGFFYCKITSPDNLKHPILQRRIKTDSGLRTVAGLGTWEAWIFSAEMDNAIKFGYNFEILNGYQFEKGYIFKKLMSLINRDSLASYQLNRVKKELNPKFDRLCRSTTEPSVNLTLLFFYFFFLKLNSFIK